MIISSSNVKYDCPILNFQLCKTNKAICTDKINQ